MLSQPERIEALLEEAELAVAGNGRELETGLKTDEEVASLRETLDGYTLMLGLMAARQLESQVAAGVPHDVAKRDVVDFLLASQRRTVLTDLEQRAEGWSLARLYQWFGENAQKRLAGSLAVGTTIVGVGAAATLGLDLGLKETGAESLSPVEAAAIFSTASVGLTGFKNALSTFLGKRAKRGIKDYSLIENAGGRAAGKDQAKVILAQSKEGAEMLVRETEERLFVIAGRHSFSEGGKPAELVSTLMQAFRDAFEDFYRLSPEEAAEDHLKKIAVWIGSAAAATPLGEATAPDVSESVEDLIEGLRSLRQKQLI